LSYYAYQKSLEGKERDVIQGYTNEQRYFIGFAQIWKINYTDEAMRQQVETNPHSPGMFRVIGPLQNMPEFWEAFDVQEGDYMRLPAEKITKLW
jgi:putative endopeptidase